MQVTFADNPHRVLQLGLSRHVYNLAVTQQEESTLKIPYGRLPNADLQRKTGLCYLQGLWRVWKGSIAPIAIFSLQGNSGKG